MPWLPDPHADQHLAGGILWASGDLVGPLFFGVLFSQWVQSSMREGSARTAGSIGSNEWPAPRRRRPAPTGSITA
jgi:cytochrome c oxidase assembly factor CtaG